MLARAASLPAPAVGIPGRHKLKGYDPVHLATALLLREEREREAARQTAGLHARRGRERRTLPPEQVERLHAEPVQEVTAEEVLMLTFDNDLHDAAVAEGIAHVRPDRPGGRSFGT